MLRPATPLSILLGAAFVLLLLSVISSPVIRSIPLARVDGISFGVFGWCRDNGECSPIEIGYNTDRLFPSNNSPDFNLPDSARHSLSSLLVVHIVAAFMCLVMLILAVLAHWHGPSHSPRYLLALLILTLPTLLVTLLAFLVDILLFIPYVSWAGWLVLASTILIVASGITLCAMRRTLVSRKARRKRIQENAEMSGENFYNRQREQEIKMTALSTESKAPLVDGTRGTDDLPTHASFNGDQRSDEFQPNNINRTVSPINDDNRYYANTSFSGPTLNNSPPTAPASANAIVNPDTPVHPHALAGPGGSQPSPDGRGYPPNAFARGRGGFVRGRGGPRGGPRGGYGPGSGRGGYMGPPPPGFRGRGGYGPPGRGRGGPYRGGPMMGGAPGPGMMYNQNQRPPPGYPPGRQNSDGFRDVKGDNDYDGSPANALDARQNQGAAYVPYAAHRQASQERSVSPYLEQQRSFDADGLVRAESPPQDIGIGHAVAMDATTGRPSNSPEARDFTRSPTSPRAAQSQEEYVPPRANWNDDQHHASTSAPVQPTRTRGSSVNSNSSKYYEDVDPRFDPGPEPVPAIPQQNFNARPHPPPAFAPEQQRSAALLPKSDSFDEIPPGAMSPTGLSETSHYTSVSQRPVNPKWNGQPSEFNSFGPPRKPVPSQARQDMLLANNPDFSVPGPGQPRSAGRGIGTMRGVPGRGPGGSIDLGGESRYPDPVVMTSREI